MTQGDEYRKRGVMWSIDEFPLKKTRPRAYLYVCERCGNEFRSNKEIHIPWCNGCRLENLDRLIADSRFKLSKYSRR